MPQMFQVFREWALGTRTAEQTDNLSTAGDFHVERQAISATWFLHLKDGPAVVSSSCQKPS